MSFPWQQAQSPLAPPSPVVTRVETGRGGDEVT